MRKKIIEIGRDSVWFFVASAVGSALGFISIPIFTQLFVPKEYGIYSLVSTAIMIGSPFFFVWLSSSALRFYPEHFRDNTLDVYYSTIYHYMPHFLLLFLAVLMPVAAFILPLGEYRTVTCLGIAIFGLYALYMVLLAMLRARQQAWQYCLLYVLAPFGRYVVGAFLVLAFKTHRVESALAAWMGILLLCIPLELIFLSARRHFSWNKFSRPELRVWFGFGFVLTFSNLFNHFLVSGDRFILQAFKGAAAVGLYSVSYNIVFGIGSLFSDFILLASVPVLNKVYVMEGDDAATQLINHLTRYLLMVLTPALLTLCVLSHRLFSVFTSAKYFPAESTVLPISLGIFFAFLGALPLQSFYLKKKTPQAIVPFGVSTAVNIGSNLALIPMMGIRGAAWSTAISYFVYLVLVVAMGAKHLRWDFPWTAAAKILFANALLCGTLFAIRGIPVGGLGGFLLIITVGALVYLAAFLLVGGFTRGEMEFAQSAAKRILVISRVLKATPEKRGPKDKSLDFDDHADGGP